MRQALLPAKGVVYLTLSATADSATLLDAAQRFSIFEPDAIVLTKLDEAARMGNCVNLALRGSLPFAYFTTGQRVPEDITLADAHALTCATLRTITECFTARKLLDNAAQRV